MECVPQRTADHRRGVRNSGRRWSRNLRFGNRPIRWKLPAGSLGFSSGWWCLLRADGRFLCLAQAAFSELAARRIRRLLPTESPDVVVDGAPWWCLFFAPVCFPAVPPTVPPRLPLSSALPSPRLACHRTEDINTQMRRRDVPFRASNDCGVPWLSAAPVASVAIIAAEKRRGRNLLIRPTSGAEPRCDVFCTFACVWAFSWLFLS